MAHWARNNLYSVVIGSFPSAKGTFSTEIPQVLPLTLRILSAKNAGTIQIVIC